MESKKVTLSEISQKANCSLATVSRVLSGSSYPVKEEIRAKILNAAEELGYIPLSLRKPKKRRATKDIGVLVPTIANQFYTQLLIGIENSCSEYGYTPIICSSRRSSKEEIENLKLLCKKAVSGIILSSISEDHAFLSKIVKQNFPIVVFDQSIKGLDVSYVKFDYFEAGRLATEYLLLKGHRRIAFASPPINRSVRQEALNGYLFALEQFLVPIRQEYLVISEVENERDYGMYDFENGKYLAGKILQLKEPVTAVFTLNDMTAFGLIDELRKQNVRVPEDISVVGFDNLDMSALFNPPLTTINQPAYEIGRLTTKILIDKITGKNSDNVTIKLRPSIIERSSVKELY